MDTKQTQDWKEKFQSMRDALMNYMKIMLKEELLDEVKTVIKEEMEDDIVC